MSTTIIQSGDANINNKAFVDDTGHVYVTSGGGGPGTGVVNVDIEGLTAFQTSQYAVGTSAVQLTPTPLANRTSVSIKVTTTSSADAVYIGNSNAVATSTGYALFDGDVVNLDLTGSASLWAIGTSAGQLVYVLEEGQ